MKEQIKTWLKGFNHDRQWLADQLHVNKRTVDNWLSSPKEIPLGTLKHIKELMDKDQAAEAANRQKLQPTSQVFSIEVDLPTFRAYSAAALASGKILEQWAIAELNAAAEAGSLPEQSPKPSASTVTSEAKREEHAVSLKAAPLNPPEPTAPGAASSSPIIKLPPLHLAADTPQSYITKKST